LRTMRLLPSDAATGMDQWFEPGCAHRPKT
jgi:hypothetical protein